MMPKKIRPRVCWRQKFKAENAKCVAGCCISVFAHYHRLRLKFNLVSIIASHRSALLIGFLMVQSVNLSVTLGQFLICSGESIKISDWFAARGSCGQRRLVSERRFGHGIVLMGITFANKTAAA
jgi:hypothetical protein